jgi:exodeoxyribonuclease V alpha subunit
VNKGVSVLTGGPGCGKTYTTQAIVTALERMGKNVTLCAPTGRAAKRMTEVIGKEAVTIHRLLKWDPVNNGFAFNEDNPLSCQYLVVDESSMIDMRLASALLSALPKKCQVLFIGDPDQLPPVGAGDFFRHLIMSGKIFVSSLTKIFRQAKDSDIIKFSHEINEGEVPNIETPILSPEILKDKSNDCLFIDSGFSNGERPSSYPKHSSLRYGLNVVQMIEKVYKETIPNSYHEPEDIQVLIPMKKGPVGTIEINRMLQESLNPKTDRNNEFKVGDRVFREKDKVIQMVNNYELNVFNGDVGRVLAIDKKKNEVHIRYGKDVIVYTRTDMLDVELAYAITIHKSQGSEFDFVIIPITNNHYRMLYRNLIYTAITRAKKLAMFIGDRKSLSIAVKNNKYEERQSSLSELIKKTIIPSILP